MRVSLAAYRLMEEVAEAHGGIDAEEARLLAAYRRAIGITDADLALIEAEDSATIAVEGDVSEREETVRAMARVALADGRLSAKERARILEVAGMLGLGRVRAANLLSWAEVERKGHTLAHGIGSHRRGIAGTVVVLLLALVAGWVLRGGGAAAGSGADRLQEIAGRADSAVVLLRVEYTLTRGSERKNYGGDGSGFFVGDRGHLVTCKHVAQPWKFVPGRVQSLENGWTLEADSLRYTAWRPGARRTRSGRIDRSEAWDSVQGGLALVRTTPDEWVQATRTLPDGSRHRGRYHALGNGDLALLQVRGRSPLGLELAPDEPLPRPLDPVVVMGYPKGSALLEGDRAVTAPSVGRVRRVEETLLVSCDIYAGNSGGPCLDTSGRVVGVATRRSGGEESLGRCLRVVHLRTLLRAAGVPQQ